MSPLQFPQIDPVIFSIGPLHVRWYGLMYVLGFSATYILVRKQIREFRYSRLANHFENLNLVLILCVVIGGRLGYVLFYNFSYYLAHPLEIPATWSGGMSFHGACIALFAGGWFYCRRQKLNFWKTADIYVATIPLGIGFGRIGNFINGELFGRKTDVPWAMIFPGGGNTPRHPSQLYEAFFEGLVLFVILWMLRSKPWGKSSWPHGSIFALFLVLYGSFRIILENFREPDQQLGYLFNLLTMGQLLSSVMVGSGILLLILLVNRKSVHR
ncbi:prolipoprotein diacylglyceryl transferase [Desulfomarina profundi]|uniref:Phosphatidylglycerol--prolipoprotein diacylglyceryl transferase n=1 Tax=Desulfomarina profundi TaxID=2772557 RepID=A0A8D5JPW9_9BACT|nr:prolipoprotein diacylglyceryl transferase [Desulfomarina profundi]BCL59406.1 prolipoprotein diacylglyceryl transferase [Desulfomarina profundi]